MYSSSSKDFSEDKNASWKNDEAVTKDKVIGSLNRVASKASKNLHLASEKIHTAADATAEHVRAKPVQSTLIALGTGYLLGKLLSR